MIPETIISITALITKVKSPRLRIFTGSVNINSMGLKKAFSIPKIAAAKNADKKPLTCIPSIKYDVVIIENVRISHLKKIPFILISFNLD
jgi:hypothetical protein